MNYYTQREWDRIVGIGKVPKEYQHPDEKDWSGQEDSNLRSPAPKAGALPGEAMPCWWSRLDSNQDRSLIWRLCRI